MEPWIPAYEKLGHVAEPHRLAPGRAARPTISIRPATATSSTSPPWPTACSAGWPRPWAGPSWPRMPRFAKALERNRNSESARRDHRGLDHDARRWPRSSACLQRPACRRRASTPSPTSSTTRTTRRARSIVAAPDRDLGTVAMAGVVPRLSETPGEVRHAGRAVGEDTRAVLSDVLGYGERGHCALGAGRRDRLRRSRRERSTMAKSQDLKTETRSPHERAARHSRRTSLEQRRAAGARHGRARAACASGGRTACSTRARGSTRCSIPAASSNRACSAPRARAPRTATARRPTARSPASAASTAASVAVVSNDFTVMGASSSATNGRKIAHMKRVATSARPAARVPRRILRRAHARPHGLARHGQPARQRSDPVRAHARDAVGVGHPRPLLRLVELVRRAVGLLRDAQGRGACGVELAAGLDGDRRGGRSRGARRLAAARGDHGLRRRRRRHRRGGAGGDPHLPRLPALACRRAAARAARCRQAPARACATSPSCCRPSARRSTTCAASCARSSTRTACSS